MRQLYDTTKKLAGRFSKPERLVKDRGGKTIADIQEQRKRRVEHLKKLLKRPTSLNLEDIKATHTDLPIDVTPKKSIWPLEKIKSEKASEPDNMPAEALKSDIEVAAKMFHILFRKI
ncbi:unnamed protein product [Schistosoma mattheei]|uniref:Uncharacterized protein n=1 Tax=Schistosoma mattheei TaxID=31246 RepID=A0A183PPA0_9TREM|nr:unnamed protein product [Schistosoma mattheei]